MLMARLMATSKTKIVRRRLILLTINGRPVCSAKLTGRPTIKATKDNHSSGDDVRQLVVVVVVVVVCLYFDLTEHTVFLLIVLSGFLLAPSMALGALAVLRPQQLATCEQIGQRVDVWAGPFHHQQAVAVILDVLAPGLGHLPQVVAARLCGVKHAAQLVPDGTQGVLHRCLRLASLEGRQNNQQGQQE